MALSFSRITGSILGFSLIVLMAGSPGGRAQETSSATAGACPNDGAVAFADPLSKPHWNGGASIHRNTASNQRRWRGSIRRTRLD